MFDRYTITALPSTIELNHNIIMPSEYQPNFNASPAQDLPVILNTRPYEAVMAGWGKVSKGSRSKEISPSSYLKHIDQLKSDEEGLERLQQKRCLVLADGFYVWKKIAKNSKVPYRVYSKSKKMICLAGMWEEFKDHKISGKKLYFFILVRQSYKPVNKIAATMPVVITHKQEKKWLEPSISLKGIYNELEMEDWALFDYYPVSPEIANKNINSSRLIKPAPPADQQGNLTLFE